ncbi:MAG: HAD-IA family hydrolase [Candidatus Saccharibacteria bacterium]|nr:HAD-IA family hydrolase [Candidatus Saccharibacteria bacterium]
MIKAIIFDCFGVLAQDGWLHYSETRFKTPVERLAASDLLKQHDAGFLTAEEFATQAAEMSGLPKEELQKIITTHQSKNDKLLGHIASLKKAGYKLSIVSNVGEDWLDNFLTKEERGLFDDILLSYKVKLLKPDPLIYMMAADRLGILTRECVFIDDRQVCVDGAKAVDMQAIRYQSFDQFIADLSTILTNTDY